MIGYAILGTSVPAETFFGFDLRDVQSAWASVHEVARPVVEKVAEIIPVTRPFIKASDVIAKAAQGDAKPIPEAEKAKKELEGYLASRDPLKQTTPGMTPTVPGQPAMPSPPTSGALAPSVSPVSVAVKKIPVWGWIAGIGSVGLILLTPILRR